MYYWVLFEENGKECRFWAQAADTAGALAQWERCMGGRGCKLTGVVLQDWSLPDCALLAI